MIQELISAGVTKPPHFVRGSIQYEARTGSEAYGTNRDDSDQDIYAFCIPSKELVFPTNEIIGFGKNKQRFEQFIHHHIEFKKSIVDLTIFNITKFFSLCMDNNPNMLDALFVPNNCINHITKIGTIVRENRKEFLHKGYWYRAKGYAYSQLNKIKTVDEIDKVEGKRKSDIIKNGYDTKFAAHTIRLLNQAEQVLIEHDLDLQKNREQIKSVRRGEWTLEQVREYFTKKESDLEACYTTSTLKHSPDEDKIKEILLNCLEEYYGSIDEYITTESRAIETLRKVRELIGDI